MYHAQLRAFHAVARHGGFSRAAERLHLTQPAVSDQVGKLERMFGVRLFDRHRRAVKLTPLGEELFRITRRLFELEDEAVELLRESQALRRGRLKMAADAPLHLIGLIGRFRQEFPGISVSLAIGNSAKVLASLFDYSADIGILANAPADDRLLRIPLRSDPLVAFVARDHPWAGRGSVSLRELSAQPLVMREEGSITRQLIEEEFRRLKITATVVMEAEGREAVCEAVAAGIGAGIISRPEFGEDPRLAVLDIEDCEKRMTESLLCLRERAGQRLIGAFWQLAARHAVREGEGEEI